MNALFCQLNRSAPVRYWFHALVLAAWTVCAVLLASRQTFAQSEQLPANYISWSFTFGKQTQAHSFYRAVAPEQGHFSARLHGFVTVTSPKRQQLLITTYRYDRKKPSQSMGALWRTDVSGKRLVLLATYVGSCFEEAVASPDGKYVAYTLSAKGTDDTKPEDGNSPEAGKVWGIDVATGRTWLVFAVPKVTNPVASHRSTFPTHALQWDTGGALSVMVRHQTFPKIFPPPSNDWSYVRHSNPVFEWFYISRAHLDNHNEAETVYPSTVSFTRKVRMDYATYAPALSHNTTTVARFSGQHLLITEPGKETRVTLDVVPPPYTKITLDWSRDDRFVVVRQHSYREWTFPGTVLVEPATGKQTHLDAKVVPLLAQSVGMSREAWQEKWQAIVQSWAWRPGNDRRVLLMVAISPHPSGCIPVPVPEPEDTEHKKRLLFFLYDPDTEVLTEVKSIARRLPAEYEPMVWSEDGQYLLVFRGNGELYRVDVR